MATIVVHRGSQQIGGCVTEIRTKNFRIFIDIGENLPGNFTKLPLVDGLTAGKCDNSALFLTHYHGDHVGCLNDVLPNVPIYIGKTAKEIYRNYAMRVAKESLKRIENFMTFVPLDHIQIGDIVVTPLMIDHSAFDAYMFVIEADGIRILHTGDFRLHGIRGRKMLKMLSCYAKGIDYIVCEGTTVSRNGETSISEHELQKRAAEMMKDAKYVFVLCASTNIDRIGAFYHANPKGRLFICDQYQKKQLEVVRQNHADKSRFYDFKNVKVYAPNLDKDMEEKGFCMLIRQGEQFKAVLEKFKCKGVLSLVSEHRMGGYTVGINMNFLVIYSMWTGYLDGRAKNQGLIDFLKPYQHSEMDKEILAPNEYRYRELHTSGHASLQDIGKLFETVKPKHGLIPIHTDAPEKFKEIIPSEKIIFLSDGESFELIKKGGQK